MPDLPRWILRRSPGSLGHVFEGGGNSLYLRMNSWTARVMPRSCPVDVRLVAWDARPVFVCALMVRLKDEDRLTFVDWLNAGYEYGRDALKALGGREPLNVFVVDDRIRRRYALDNVVHQVALSLYRRANAYADAWNTRCYDRLFQTLTKRYPSNELLWKAGLSGAIHSGA